MASGIRIGSAVIFVEQLARSVSFYGDVLALQVTDESPTAALLTSPGGAQLYLRAMGATAAHPLGGVGVQYVTWIAAGEDELGRCEQALKNRSAFRDRHQLAGITAVEGHDPDGVVVMITYPGPDQSPVRELPARIYGW
jgi:catechol 2,3-dioxygenase-like lactoylglutathione lyase family enzyme